MRILCITPIDGIDDVKANLQKLGELKVISECTRNELLGLKDWPEVIFTNPNKQTFVIDDCVIDALPNLRAILTASTGLNHIDVRYASSKNVVVASLTKELAIIEKITSTAEHAFGLMLSIIRNIPVSHESVIKNSEWNYVPFIGRQLNCLTVGIIGYGRLGKMFSKYAKAFGMKVLVFDPNTQCDDSVTLEKLKAEADVVTLHVHVSPQTKRMIDGLFISEMKDGVYLINTSRGAIVDEQQIAFALMSKKIAGYATDVICDELGGSVDINPIVLAARQGQNVIVTPHIGGMTSDARKIAYNSVVNIFRDRLENHNDDKIGR